MSVISSLRMSRFPIFAALIITVICLSTPVGASAQESYVELVEAWRDALVAMDAGAYGNLLHADYLFVSYDLELFLDRDADLLATTNMLSGHPCQTDQGELLQPVASISFPSLVQQAEWEQTPPGDPYFPNTYNALYQYTLVLHLESAFTITAQGDAILYAAEAGPGKTYALDGIRDLGLPGRNEDMTLSDLKGLYANSTVGNESAPWSHIKRIFE